MARDFCVVLAYALRAYGELGAAIPAGYAALSRALVVLTVMHYFVFNGDFLAFASTFVPVNIFFDPSTGTTQLLG